MFFFIFASCFLNLLHLTLVWGLLVSQLVKVQLHGPGFRFVLGLVLHVIFPSVFIVSFYCEIRHNSPICFYSTILILSYILYTLTLHIKIMKQVPNQQWANLALMIRLNQTAFSLHNIIQYGIKFKLAYSVWDIGLFCFVLHKPLSNEWLICWSTSFFDNMEALVAVARNSSRFPWQSKQLTEELLCL